jgi:hypothetical protein
MQDEGRYREDEKLRRELELGAQNAAQRVQAKTLAWPTK